MKKIFFLIGIIVYIFLSGENFYDYIKKINIYDNFEQMENDSILLNDYTFQTINKMLEYIKYDTDDWTKKRIAIRILSKVDSIYNDTLFILLNTQNIDDYDILKIFNKKALPKDFIENIHLNENENNTIAYIDYMSSMHKIDAIIKFLNSKKSIIRNRALNALLNNKDMIKSDIFDTLIGIYKYNDINSNALLNQIIANNDTLISFVKEYYNTHNELFVNFMDILSYSDKKDNYVMLLDYYQKYENREQLFIQYIISKKNNEDSTFFEDTLFQNYKKIIKYITGEGYDE